MEGSARPSGGHPSPCLLEEGWIADNEVWQEHKRFTKWFTDIGTVWQAVLAREDLEVGLEVQGGKQGGYRGTLITLLKR